MRQITHIKIYSVDTIATMLALRKFLKIKVSKANQIAKMSLGVFHELDKPIEIDSNLSNKEIEEELNHYHIFVKFKTNQ